MDKAVTSHTPKVTVLMPVYNGERFLAEALESVRTQTFRDFEFLVIDDGSTDASASIVRACGDSRIRLVLNGENLGLVATLNRGVELSCGEYVVRMDCDDISLPQRLERQVAFMESHPEVGVCGTWYREFGAGATIVTRCAPDHDTIRCGSLFNPVVGHPTVIMRRSIFERHALRYDAAYPHAEDYELWARALDCCRFANIPEVLLHYRVHAAQVTRQCAERQLASAGQVRLRLLRRLGIDPTPEEFDVHQMLSSLTRPLSFECQEKAADLQLEEIDRWLCTLKRANDRVGIYPEPEFSRMLAERWVGVCCVNFVARGSLSARLVRSALLRAIPGGYRQALSFTARRGVAWLRDRGAH